MAGPVTYGVLGVGAIGTAIVTGLCEEVDDAPRVLLSPRSAETTATLAERFDTVEIAADNQAVVDGASVVIVCLPPEDAETELARLRFAAGLAVLSAVAGVSVQAIQRNVAPATNVARVIPLPSVASRDCVTAVHPPNEAAAELFGRLGEPLEVPDPEAFDALACATASLATHFAYLGAIAAWLEAHGIPAPMSTRYVASIYAGLADATRSTTAFTELAQEVATPGGLNEQFLAGLERAGTFEDVRLGLDGILDRLRQGGAT
jgi:pyrroline-5-carboxylate reductase